MPDPAAGLAVDLVLDLVDRSRPMPSGTRLVCVDGQAGAGKTMLADRLVAALPGRGYSTALVHMDDVYDGWDGLADAGPTVARDVVEPVAAGRAGRYRRYDWHLGRYAGSRPVPVRDVLVVEGVGAGHPGFAHLTGVLVFVEAPEEVRLDRGLERDGVHLAPQWRRWLLDERRLHEAERTRARADVVVDGVSGRVVRRSAAVGGTGG